MAGDELDGRIGSPRPRWVRGYGRRRVAQRPHHAPPPVGPGLAGALALGSEGVWLGTRFLATHESPLHASFKQAIVDSDGHDTVLTEIPDLASQRVWPGAMSRAKRNGFIERWAGREWALRRDATEVGKQVAAARAAGDVDNASLSFGQDAGLIDSIKSVKEVIQDIIAEAEEILRDRLPALLR